MSIPEEEMSLRENSDCLMQQGVCKTGSRESLSSLELYVGSRSHWKIDYYLTVNYGLHDVAKKGAIWIFPMSRYQAVYIAVN